MLKFPTNWRNSTLYSAVNGSKRKDFPRAEAYARDHDHARSRCNACACCASSSARCCGFDLDDPHANHLRPNRDGLKVGGHQASCASVATLMTALYFDVLRPQDRVAVKPHAAPVFHAHPVPVRPADAATSSSGSARFGGAQSYPVAHQGRRRRRFLDRLGRPRASRMTLLRLAGAGLCAAASGWRRPTRPPGRMIALAGDAELDEGNIFEALLEGWKHDVRNLWWIIDYNRQSLDARRVTTGCSAASTRCSRWSAGASSR